MSKEKQDSLKQDSTIITDNSTFGDIKINHTVVASIVKLAALKVVGVHTVGGSFYDGIAEIFNKKGDVGVKVAEDEAGCYLIDLRIVMNFGVELAKVAYQVQQSVSDQVRKMTHKEVSKVNVIIDEVKLPEENSSQDNDDWNAPHTD